MTVLNVAAALTALGGSVPVSSGRITVEYLRSGVPAARVDGATVTLPAPVVAEIVDGSPAVPLDVPPTDGTCYARVWIECRVPRDAGFLELAAVAIPATGPVDIADLVAVDPASYAPITTVVTAWELAVGEVDEMRVTVEAKTALAIAAAADAGTFAGATEFDAGRAGQSAFQAGQSAATALGHKNDAKGSADAAAGSATSAAGAVVAANLERQGAADERLGARTERQDAQTARTGAETAQSGAVTARSGAETARTGAETAKTGSETARTGAEQARDLALAGQFLGSFIPQNTDLDALTTAGMYRLATATGIVNAPYAGFLGNIMVLVRDTGARITQVAFRQNGAAAQDSRGIWMRSNHSAGFTPWRFVSTQRINNPGGQPGVEVLTWDDANNREQALMPVGVPLGSVDLNAVTLPGVYTQSGAAEALASRNYPSEGGSGTLEVLPNGTGLLIQRYTVRHASNRGRNGVYSRTLQSGTFSAWTFISSQRVDQTAGRAIYTWDDVNGREQLLWGDTGWRDIGALMVNGWVGQAYIRRNGGIVSLKFEALDPSARTATNVISLPAGFRGGVGANDRFVLFNAPAGAAVTVYRGGVTPTTVDVTAPTAAGLLYGAIFSYPTNDAWSTVLPGAAVGSIPT